MRGTGGQFARTRVSAVFRSAGRTAGLCGTVGQFALIRASVRFLSAGRTAGLCEMVGQFAFAEGSTLKNNCPKKMKKPLTFT